MTGSASVSEIGLDQIVSDGKILVNGTLTSVESGSDTAAITGSTIFGDIEGTLAATELTSDSYSSYPAWIEGIGPRTLSLRKDTLFFTGAPQDGLSFLLEKDSLAIEVFSKYS